VDTLPVDEAQESHEPESARARHLLTAVGLPVGIFLASRFVQVILITWLAPPDGLRVRDRFLIWDATWFVQVASQGYPHGYTYDPDGVMNGNGLAFFPGYPLLIRAVHLLGVDAGTAAILISWTAGAVACVLLFLLGRDLARDRLTRRDWAANEPLEPDAGAGEHATRVGYALVVLFCAQPMSVVLSMGYSEALFCALAIGTLLAAYRRHWLTAAAIGLGAALTRPTGLAVAVALATAALLAARKRGGGWRPMVGSLVAVAGVPGYLFWVGLRVGHPNAWFTIQTAGWGTTTDLGRSTAQFMVSALRTGTGWVQMNVVFLLIAAVVAAVIAVRQRTWPPLALYGLLALASAIGQAGYYHSKPRLLVPVLLTLLPGAYAAARTTTRTACLALAGYAAFGLWYGAYMITVWPYTI
jgi:hypothetical protein